MKQKKRKRLLNLLVTLAMVTGLMQGISLTAYADGEHTHDGVTFVEWTDALAQEQWDNSGRTAANSLPVEAGNYYLTQDVMLTDQWNVPFGTTNLCLGGKTITGNLSESANHDYSVVYIEGGSTLNLCDDEEGAGKIVSEEYTFTEEGRKFTVMVTDVHVYSSTFNMYGGTLCATDGKQIVNGVVVNGGTFTMAGGTIRGARLSGVFVGSRRGVFTMNGGTITGNRALHGGGVAVDENGVFTMNGGSIAGNEAFAIETKDAGYKGGQGGGVYVEAGGVFTMNGGSITGNDAQRHGGGVYNKGTFRISGAPEISGNTHTHDPVDPCADNVYLERDKVVNVAGELTGAKPIGITMQGEDVFTSGEASGYKAKFASDYEEFTVAVKGKELMLQHLRHSMSYEASGATVTAECAWPDSCSLPGGKVALTIKAPARTTYGGEGSAAATLEGLDNFNEACGLSLAAADIRYYKARKNGSTYTKDGDALGAAPSDAGDFLAEMPVPINGEGACVYATVSYTIAKAASVVTKAPAARKLTYTEMAQKLVTKGEAAGGTMQYALGTETEATDPFTAAIPTGTNVGTYYVWYKVVGDSQHTDSEPACVRVEIEKGVSLSLSEKKLLVGQEFALTAKVTPDDAADKTVTWSSSRPEVATVSKDGVVKTVRAGSCVITAALKNGAKAKCRITVKSRYVYQCEKNGVFRYTVSAKIIRQLRKEGWSCQKVFRAAGKSGNKVYWVYNRKTKRFCWTSDRAYALREKKAGNKAGLAFYASESKECPVYELCLEGKRPTYFYTMKRAEAKAMKKAGWTYKGIAFYSEPRAL